MPNPLDPVDRRILVALQKNGRLTNVDLAERVGLSPSPCLRRVRLLEEAGIIQRYVAVLDEARIGAGFTVFARVGLKGQDQETVGKFTKAILAMPEVIECHLMAGDCDFLLRVVAADMDAYWRFQVEHLGRIASIQNIKSEIPMRRIKQSTELPVRAHTS